MFHSTPNLTGPKQHAYKRGDFPARISYKSINQQYLAELGWTKLLNMCTVTVGTMGAFIADHKGDHRGWYFDIQETALFGNQIY